MGGKTSAKAEQRRSMKTVLGRLERSFIESASIEIRRQIPLRPGSRIALFAGTTTEPQLLDLIQQNPQIDWFLPKVTGSDTMDFLPVSSSDDLEKGFLGILEPHSGTPATELDLIICPGVAFTDKGGRLGQGGGFYDRALARFPSAERIGVTFSCQLVEQLPTRPHDIQMHRVITNPLGQPS